MMLRESCKRNCVLPVPLAPKISVIKLDGIPPERNLSIFCKPVENYTFFTDKIKVWITVLTQGYDHGFSIRRPGRSKVESGPAGDGSCGFCFPPVGNIKIWVPGVVG